MATIRTYRDLIAWQRGMKLSKEIYKATRQMPREEMFGLTAQIRQAAVSIPSNIAEGYGLGTTRQYLKHLRIARGSLAEVSTQYELTIELEMLTPSPALWDLLEETERVLQGLIRSLQSKRKQSGKSKE